MSISTALQQRLFALQDTDYKVFQCKLMPTVEPETVIGVRMPALRRLAKVYAKEPEAATFLQSMPHRYYEENNLHGLLICGEEEYGAAIDALNTFLPYVDNWATCDLFRPKAFATRPSSLLPQLKRWMTSPHAYTVRFGIEMLMTLYLDEAFSTEYPEWVAMVTHDDYYVRMMVAWYFATALVKQYEAVLPFIQGQRLAIWTHNKAIQKAIESYRITSEQKAELIAYRRKP